jgi:hypothetical protein
MWMAIGICVGIGLLVLSYSAFRVDLLREFLYISLLDFWQWTPAGVLFTLACFMILTMSVKEIDGLYAESIRRKRITALAEFATLGFCVLNLVSVSSFIPPFNSGWFSWIYIIIPMGVYIVFSLLYWLGLPKRA